MAGRLAQWVCNSSRPTSSTFDSTAFAITINSRSTVGLNLVGGRTAVVPVTFTMPTSIDPVNYTIFAAVTPGEWIDRHAGGNRSSGWTHRFRARCCNLEKCPRMATTN